MDDFSVHSIAEIGRIVTGKTPSSSTPDDFGGATPFVTPSDSFDHRYIGRTERSLSAQGVRKLRGKLLPPDSVLVTCIGSAMGKVAMTRVACITNQQINSLVVTEDYSPHYICYALKNSYKQLRNAATGSTALPLLSKGDFGLLRIRIHSDKLTQQRIAAVLSGLDAKIDLNNRINAELEALAKTIHDYWFVQFDFPDAHGRPYKSSGGAMVWNDTLKRDIPAGWEAKPLHELVAEVRDGVTPENLDAATPYIGLEHIARKSIVLASWATAEQATSNKTRFRRGDILFGKIRPYFHKVAFATIDGVASTDAIVMRPRAPELAGVALETVFSDRFVEAATASSTGSKMPRADWKVMKQHSVALPPAPLRLLHEYQASFEAITGKIANHVDQNRELSRLRDWLLPLLMNGQVRVG